MTLTLMDWFCGAGGSSQGAHAVPGVEVTLAANHWQLAIDSDAQGNAGDDDTHDEPPDLHPHIRFPPLNEWFTPPEQTP